MSVLKLIIIKVFLFFVRFFRRVRGLCGGHWSQGQEIVRSYRLVERHRVGVEPVKDEKRIGTDTLT